MIVLQLNVCPPGVRGDVTKWLMEISSGVYVGQLSLRARDALWKRVCAHAGSGSAVMVCSARNEQGFVFYVHNTDWQPVDYDGIALMQRPLPDRRKKQGRDNPVPPEPTVPAVLPSRSCPPPIPAGPKSSCTPSTVNQPGTDRQPEAVSVKTYLTINRAAGSPEAFSRDTSLSEDPPFKRRLPPLPLPYTPWPEREPLPASFTVLDMETTGLDPDAHQIIEIACIQFRNGTAEKQMNTLVKCGTPLPEVIRTLTGLTDETLDREGIPLSQAIPDLLRFLDGDCLVGHNIAFDIRFLLAACGRLDIHPPDLRAIDTVALSRKALFHSVSNFRLETLIRHLHIAEKQSHRALPDALLTAQLYLKLNEILLNGH